ncbi:MAG: RES family NAD+ phosphorylase [Acidimicrobiales bacterium]|nr:RES family NAD+ phosphorylase [Acidimicrobiales bacterium]
MYGDFPPTRPAGLRRRTLRTGAVWWRIDAQATEEWSWTGFSEPRNRFDPESGGFRVRYAGTSLAGAARERYEATGRYIPVDHAGHHLVRLQARRPVTVLDLRTDRNLDALGLDDRVSTGREPQVWQACHRLVDAARHWWSDASLDGLVYRCRTTPSGSTNLAFFSLDPFQASSRRLDECPAELADLVLRSGFTIGFDLRAGNRLGRSPRPRRSSPMAGHDITCQL